MKHFYYFNTEVLNKHLVSYYRCNNCYFIQTEDPYWLNEAYDSAIADIDTGYIQRNLDMVFYNNHLIKWFFSSGDKRYLDFGGGYGMFVRMMRDKGYDFYLYDTFCANIFAKNFSVTNIESVNKYSIITAFELFEHLPDPLATLTSIFTKTDTFIFSTLLQPRSKIYKPEDWWYFIPETGQHVSLYHLATLRFIAKKYSMHFYTNYRNVHIFTRDKKFINPLYFVTFTFYVKYFIKKYILRNTSLMTKDFHLAKAKFSLLKV